MWAVGAALALFCAGQMVTSADPPVNSAPLILKAGQKDFLTQEPILLTVQVDGPRGTVLPAGPGKVGDTTLRFEVSPAVKARPNAKPLPLEAKGADLPATIRTYDLLEWFQFPAQGSWTVQAIVEHKGTTLRSVPLPVTIGRPAKGDKEQNPVDRLHHTPWSNYTTDAFCGDCFDLVKQWPDSRLARYAHYWNGVFHQHKKEYDKAIASYRTVLTNYPNFVLADHAEYGIIECLTAQSENAVATDRCADLIRRLHERDGKAGTRTAQLLADRTATLLIRQGEARTNPPGSPK
jgi:hypothetical protein